MHWNCAICQNGNYDLCFVCFCEEVRCPGGRGHAMVKYSIRKGEDVVENEDQGRETELPLRPRTEANEEDDEDVVLVHRGRGA